MVTSISTISKQANQPYTHLNPNVDGLKPSATLAINELSNSLIAEGKKVYKFGLGQSPFPVPKTVVKALKQNAFQKDYLPVKGLASLRLAVAESNKKTLGISCTLEDVMIGPGSKELLFLLQFAYGADLVLPSSSWVSYAPQASIIGNKVHWLATEEGNDWRLSPETLEAHCLQHPNQPQILLLNYPNNPIGTTYSTSELEGIAAIAQKYQILVLSDEIYGEVHYEGKHVSIAAFYPEGTIVSSGLSKWCGAGGWRLGTFTFPSNLRYLLDAMAAVASETFTSVSAPIQHAAIRAFEGGEAIDLYLQDSRRILKVIGETIAQKLHNNHVSLPLPKGGFYLFPNFSHYKEKLNAKGIFTSSDFCQRLLEETGVAILPANAFGRPDNDLIARMAYVNFDGKKALKVARKEYADKPLDDDFLKKCCGETMEGIDVLVNWLKQ
ncbi:MAG: pyridoxal phosphate-dependent aminotransferase [Chitinophagales bacterium]